MINLNEFTYKNKFEDITNGGLLKDDWFVGSALNGIDFKNLKKGQYYYFQETLWSRILNLDEINTYWRLHNETYNYLIVDGDFTKILADFIRYMSVNLNIELTDFYILGPKFDMKDINSYEYKLPFYIENEEVGTYLRIFAKKKNRFFPLTDCTLFTMKEKEYFEININKIYVDLVDNFKFSYFEISDYSILKNKVSYSVDFYDLKLNTNKIKLLSLIDSINSVCPYFIKTGSKYVGHTIKTILKKIAILILILKQDMDKVCKGFNEDYLEFISKEIDRIERIDLDSLKKYSEFQLKDELGISQDIINYKKNLNVINTIPTKVEDIRYFTDIPLIEDINNEEKFLLAINNVLKNK